MFYVHTYACNVLSSQCQVHYTKLYDQFFFTIHDCFRYHECVVVCTLQDGLATGGHILHNISLGTKKNFKFRRF